MKRGRLVQRLTVMVGLMTSVIVLLVALSIAALVYFQTELNIRRELARAAVMIVRDELMGESGKIRLQKEDGGQSLTVLLRNLDLSLIIRDATGTAIASYGIYRTIPSLDSDKLAGALTEATKLGRAVYVDKEMTGIGRVDTYSLPLLEGSHTVGSMQLTRINNIWSIIGKSLGFALLVMLPIIWVISAIGIRWGTKRTLAPLSELVSAVEALDVDELPETLGKPHAMDEDVGVLYSTLSILIARIRATIKRQREISENLSHEFKTPLTRIATRLGLLSGKIKADDRRIVDVATAELVDLGEQVDGLLDVAIYGSIADRGTSLRLKFFVENMVATIAHKGHTVVVDIPPDFHIRIPQGHARIIIRNLLDNAIKYGSPGTDIHISTVRDGKGWSLVVANAVDTNHIPTGNIFRRRFRGVGSRTHGYGLGLAIVKDVTKQLGFGLTYRVSNNTVTITVSGTL